VKDIAQGSFYDYVIKFKVHTSELSPKIILERFERLLESSCAWTVGSGTWKPLKGVDERRYLHGSYATYRFPRSVRKVTIEIFDNGLVSVTDIDSVESETKPKVRGVRLLDERASEVFRFLSRLFSDSQGS